MPPFHIAVLHKRAPGESQLPKLRQEEGGQLMADTEPIGNPQAVGFCLSLCLLATLSEGPHPHQKNPGAF